jgi:hypothetical protein
MSVAYAKPFEILYFQSMIELRRVHPLLDIPSLPPLREGLRAELVVLERAGYAPG